MVSEQRKKKERLQNGYGSKTRFIWHTRKLTNLKTTNKKPFTVQGQFNAVFILLLMLKKPITVDKFIEFIKHLINS